MRDRHDRFSQPVGRAAQPDYSAEFERRVKQFNSYLSRGYERALKIAEGPCFMIFSEAKGSTGDDDPELAASEKLVAESVIVGFADGHPLNPSLEDIFISPVVADDAWRRDETQSRFVQFCFEQKWFCLDLPLQTLYQAEAAKILRDRLGFFYLRNRPEYTLYEEDVDGYDPFRKIYLYGDEPDSATDMASIFFSVWQFPVDSRLYVNSAAFGKDFTWERDMPIA